MTVDTTRLYEGTDPLYELWLAEVLNQVIEVKRQAAEQQRTS